MNIRYVLFFLSFFIYFGTAAQQRSVTELQTGWKFQKGQINAAHLPSFDDSNWREVHMPHDWGVDGGFISDGDGNTGKLPWKGQGWYRKSLNIPSTERNRIVYLLFDGIMAFPTIYINGIKAGSWDYGYNSFYLDITNFVNFGEENKIAIHVDTRNHDSRWYPGAGLYRKVQLLIANPIHVDIWGNHITTPDIKPNYADVQVATTINNLTSSSEDLQVRHTIFTENNIQVTQNESSVNLPPHQQTRLESMITIPSPRLWNLHNPHLYQVTTEILQNGHLLDTYQSSFGIRGIRFTADHGFYLNDKRIQLKGVNLHHDHGPLGGAFNKRAMQRQLEIMKSMGCNAIRNSHNTAAPELLDLCDEMGLLVFNEIFDKYDEKADILDTTNFENFAHRNIRNFVVRDRNHPSIFLWSVGNEISDVQWNKKNGFYRLQTMLNYLLKYDDTRFTTLVCDNQESAVLGHFNYYDIHCWNYGRRYALARKLEPNKAVIISESASTLSSRGFYELPLPERKTDFTASLQVSSYDLNAPAWAELADDDFMWQQDEPYIAGEFVWTGFDYLGEPTPYNNNWTGENGMTDYEASRSSYFGIVDLCGIPKDRYYLYKSYWNPEETTVHILPHWNWPDRIGQNVPVFIYTNGDCAELFLNENSLGLKCKDPKSQKSTDRFRLMWNDVLYQPGTLKAVAFKEGKVLGEQQMRTAGKPYRLRLTPDRIALHADGKDLSYITIEALDEDGNLCPLAKNKINIKLLGTGRIAGVGNGNPQSLNPFKSSTVDLFHGKAMLIVGSEFSAGSIDIEVDSKGLESANQRLTCTAIARGQR